MVKLDEDEFGTRYLLYCRIIRFGLRVNRDEMIACLPELATKKQEMNELHAASWAQLTLRSTGEMSSTDEPRSL